MWMYVLTLISAIMLFGFMGIGIKKYGLLSCYSDYGALWGEWYPKLNIWSVITFITAFLIIPVMLEVSVLNPWQFLGFLAPVSLFWVAGSPNYKDGGFINVMHQVGAWGAVVAALAYVCIIPHLWWLALPYAVVAVILGIIFKGTLMLWGEVAVYLTIYTALLMMI